MNRPNIKQATAIRMVAMHGGLIVTRCEGRGEPIFTFRDGSGGLPASVANQLIKGRMLVAVDHGLFGDAPQSYRVKTPKDF